MMTVREVLELFSSEALEVALYDNRTGESQADTVGHFLQSEDYEDARNCEVEAFDYDWSDTRLCINYTSDED